MPPQPRQGLGEQAPAAAHIERSQARQGSARAGRKARIGDRAAHEVHAQRVERVKRRKPAPRAPPLAPELPELLHLPGAVSHPNREQ